MWQSAPGNDETIDQTIEEVMEHENAQLKAFALALITSSPQYFINFL